MHELPTYKLERSSTFAGLAPHATRLVATPDHGGTGRQQRGCQPVDETRPRGRSGGAPPPTATRCPTSAACRAAGPPARTLAPWRRSLWLPRAGLDPWSDRRGDSAGVWRQLPPESCRPLAQGHALESPKAYAASPPAGRSEHCPLARGDLAGHQKGAQAHGHSLFFIDESGFYPLPSVVRTYAPVGHTPILKEWWTRDHLSAMSAMSPEGKLYFHCQDWA